MTRSLRRGERARGWLAGSDAATAAWLFAAAFGYFALLAHRTFETRDEGYLYYRIQQVAAGAIPHRDLVDVYGPGVFALCAPLFELLGEEILALRMVLAGLRAAGVALAYGIARHLVERRFAVLGAAIATAFWGRVLWNLNTPYAALFTIPLGMLALLLLLRGLERGERRWIFAAGCTCGLALLFKQSLAAAIAFGLLAAIAASAMRGNAAAAPSRAGRTVALALWALAAAALLLPFAAAIRPLDYALHFLPIHASMALVGLRFARRGDPRAALERALPRALVFGLGLAIPPSAVALLYASWGALDALVRDMFALPLELRNYYEPVALPPAESVALIGGVAAVACGGLLLVRGRRGPALVTGLGGAALAALPALGASSFAELGLQLYRLNWVLPAALGYAALALLAPRLTARDGGDERPATDALVAALLFQQMLAFQIFPRAGFNVMLMQGALAPIAAWVLSRWAALARAPRDSRRAWAAFAWVALVPAVLLLPIVAESATRLRGLAPGPPALSFPGARGIRLAPGDHARHEIAVFEQLVEHVRGSRPPDAPLALLNNEFMIQFLSGRRDLFADYTYLLHLFGWDMLPDHYRERMPGSELIERLERADDPIVVDKSDFSSVNLRRHYPELFRYVESRFRVDHRIGLYRVWRKKRP